VRAARLRSALVLAALAALVGVGGWLIATTPATLLSEQPGRKGPTPGPEEAITVPVAEGDGAGAIGARLEQAGVLESGRLFRVLVSLMGVEGELVDGEYEFSRGEATLEVIDRMRRGQTMPLVVTIPEGLRAEEVAELLQREGVVPAGELLLALPAVNYKTGIASGLPPDSSVEGFLFPATYGFSRRETGRSTVQKMLDAFARRVLPQLPPPGAFSRPLREIVTLASIVEREAQVASERPVIASVLLNRLAFRIPLQADPTVQYAVGGDPANVARFGYWKRELSVADLQLLSPYNTYVNPGLPPGPIANPGLDAILAVVRPAQTGFLFFVARPDGSHVFAQTLEEHRRNVCQLDPTRPECAPAGAAP